MLHRTRFLVAAAAVGCFAGLGITAWPSGYTSLKQAPGSEERQRRQKERLRNAALQVHNLTRLVVVRVEKDVDHDLIRVSLRNDYEKTVTAYKVSVGVGTIQTECLTEETGDTALLYPGSLREETYPLQVDVETLGIKILAVMFDDKTSDGEPQSVREIRDYRRGMKIGMEQCLQLLKNIPLVPRAEMPQTLARVQLQLSQASEPNEKELPHFVSVGLHDVRYRIAHYLMSKQGMLLDRQNISSELAGRRQMRTLVDRLTETISKL